MQQSCPISEPSVHKRGGHGSTWARHEKKEIWSQNLGPGPADQAGATGCADPEGWIACGLWSLCISRCRVGVELLKDFTEISWDGYLHRCSDITSGNLASHRKSRLQHGNQHFVGHGPKHKTRAKTDWRQFANSLKRISISN